MSLSSFADLGVAPPLAAALAAEGISTPFPVQHAALPDALAGHDVLVRSPTGSGKTLAFAIPVVQRADKGRRPSALIVAPTRELAGQIERATRPLAAARSMSVCAVYGGVGLPRQASLARRAHILVATPGRLLDLIDRGDVSLANVQVLVLDEADRMLDMGFRPAVQRIVNLIPTQRQTMLLSATLDGEVGRLAARYTRSPRRHDVVPAAAADSPEGTPGTTGEVEHRFLMVEHAVKLPTLVQMLRDGGHGPTLVFVRTKRGADRLVKQLRGHDVEAVAMHGNKSQSQREKALARFRAGGVDTLVATDVAARGIDVDCIRHVINFDAPGGDEDYVHRVGRTGRAGRSGLGTTLVLHEQQRDVARMAAALDLPFGGSGRGEGARSGTTAAHAPARPRPARSRRGTRRSARG